jgi:hypothetical protein
MNNAKLIFLILVLTVATASARNYDTLFADRMEVDQVPLDRVGVSKLTVGWVFDVYVAAFYLPEGSTAADALADKPRHLEISYLRRISREDFINAGADMLQQQHPPDVIAGIQSGIDQINGFYQDVAKGDRYALTYLPGIGTELKFNGETKGVIPGEDFARIYFSIWLGENNPYKSFRDQLVGLRN